MLVNQMTINPKIGLDIFWIFGFCDSQIFWMLDSQMLTIDKSEDRARHFLDFRFLWFSDFLDFGFVSDADYR